MYEPINRIKTIQKKILMIENIINEFEEIIDPLIADHQSKLMEMSGV